MRVPPREGRLTILQPDCIWISLIRVPDLPMIQPTTPGSRSMTKVASGRLICEESAAYSSSKKELGRPPSIERLAVTAARSEGGERHPGLPAVVLGRWVVSSSPRSVGRRLSATGSSGPLYTVSATAATAATPAETREASQQQNGKVDPFRSPSLKQRRGQTYAVTIID